MALSRKAALAAFSGLCATVVVAGCALVKLSEDSQAFYSSTVLCGRVESSWQAPVVVAAYKHGLGGGAIAHQTRLHEPGGYELIVPNGLYGVFAFADLNDNGSFDEGEPTGEYGTVSPVAASGMGVVANLDVALNPPPPRPVFPPGTVFRNAAAPRYSTQVGALANLDDALFTSDSGSQGYWAPVEFFKRAGGNVYFLEPFDPKRIPILFVHGAAGSAQDWRYFFDHLDRTRYQAWFFQYPSGASVESMAYLLYWKLLNLQVRYRFERLYITAHSMGGLVVRTLLLDHAAELPQIKLFVSLSTPWAGEATAELGVKRSPAVVPSWRDMQPDGRFMIALFARPLPPSIDYYLLFGHKGGYSMLRPNNDGAVTLASQLRNPAQAEARMVFGFDEDHASILRSPQVLAQWDAILAHTTRGGGAGQTGAVNVHFVFDDRNDGPRGLPILLLSPTGLVAGERRDRVVIPLAADQSGVDVGPVPAGEYEASVVLSSFRTEPRRLRVKVEAGRTPTVSFRLIPQGTLSGYVGTDATSLENPAGSFRRPHPDVKILSLALTGPGIRRELTPRPREPDDTYERYLEGQDDAYGAWFSFVALPIGDYELTIIALGYQPFTRRYTVLPGKPSLSEPIELVRAR